MRLKKKSRRAFFYNSLFNKLVSSLVILSFIATSVVLPPSSFAEIASSPAGARNDTLFPQELGTIDEAFKGTSDKTIIFIQDAHDSLEAQQNIAKIIQTLVKDHGIKTVFEEGYEGPVPTDEFFGSIKEADVKEKVSFFFLDQLRIGAAEYAHINRKDDFKLVGADSSKLHLENIAWAQKNSKIQAETEKDIAELSKYINKLASQYFPKEIKDWMKLRERFDNKQLSLLDYLKRLVGLGTVPGKDRTVPEYPNISLLLESQSSKDPKLLDQVKAIDAKTLFAELGQAEEDLAKSYLKDERGQKIFHYHNQLSLLSRLNRLEVTPEEFEVSKNSLKDLNTANISEFIVKKTQKSLVLSTRWETNIQSAIHFYETAHARDGSIEKALQDFKANSKEKTAILVFGGFHKANVKELLKKEGLSYTIISPRITKEDPKHKTSYQELMSAGYHPYELPNAIARSSRPESIFQLALSLGKTPVLDYIGQLANYVRTKGAGLADAVLSRTLTKAVAPRFALALAAVGGAVLAPAGRSLEKGTQKAVEGKSLGKAREEALKKEVLTPAAQARRGFLGRLGEMALLAALGGFVGAGCSKPPRDEPYVLPSLQTLSPSSTGIVTPLPLNSAGQQVTPGLIQDDNNGATKLLGDASTIPVFNQVGISVGYDVSGSRDLIFSGFGLVADGTQTPAVRDTLDLSGLPTLTVALRGTSPSFSHSTFLELQDTTGRIVRYRLTGISSTFGYYTLNIAAAQPGLDLTQISTIAIIENPEIGASAPRGTYTVVFGNVDTQYLPLAEIAPQPLNPTAPLQGASTLPVNDLAPQPTQPTVSSIQGGTAATSLTRDLATQPLFGIPGVKWAYDVSTGGFSVMNVSFEEFTAAGIQTGNANAVTPTPGQITLSIRGDSPAFGSALYADVIDIDGNRARFALQGITNQYQNYTLDLTGPLPIDPTKIVNIQLTTDQQIAGTATAGSYSVVVGGVNTNVVLVSRITGQISDTLTDYPLNNEPTPKQADVQVAVSGGNSASQSADISTIPALGVQGRLWNYNLPVFGTNTTPTGYAAMIFTLDNWGTGPVETGDFSGMGSLTFAVRGASTPYHTQMLFEITDQAGNKARFLLDGITDTFQYFTIPLSDLPLDLSKVKETTFLIDPSIATAAQPSGSFVVVAKNISGASLGAANDMAEDFNVAERLDDLRANTTLYVDFRNIKAKQMNEAQLTELFGYALDNPEKVKLVIHNAEIGDEALEFFRDVKNKEIVTGDINLAFQQFGTIGTNIQLSKEGVDPAKDFTADRTKMKFFRYQAEETGLVAVALLYSELYNDKIQQKLAGIEEQNGYFIVVGQILQSLVQDYEAQRLVKRAA